MATMIVDEGRSDLMAWKCATQDFEFGARLNVHESQMAVFFRDGQAVSVLGPGMHVLETRNMPFIRKFTKLRFGRYFHCEVYFVNLSVHMSIPWGTRDRINVYLEVEPGKSMPLSVGASGTMNVQPDPEQVTQMLTWLLGTGNELTEEDMKAKFNSMLNTKIKTFFGRVLQQQNINAFSLDQHLNDVSMALQAVLAPEFLKYGILLREFYVDSFALPEDNHAFQEARMLAEGRYVQHGKMDLEYDLREKQAERERRLAELEREKALVEADTKAKVTAKVAEGEAVRRSYEGITSVQEHQFDTMEHMIDAQALSGSNAGNSGSGAGFSGGMGGDMTGMFADVMKMGIGLEMAKSMGGVMKDAMNSGGQAGANMSSVMNTSAVSGQTYSADPTAAQNPVSTAGQQPSGWQCSCGAVNPANSRFCGYCGSKREG